MASKSQKVWIRTPNFSLSAPAGAVNQASVQSLRTVSTVLTAGGQQQLGLPNEFTVVRLIGHWYVEHFANPAASGVTNNNVICFGARVAGAEEIEEMAVDAGFATESGPALDPMADWMAWVPCFPDSPSGFDANATEITAGKGMFDLRAARRVDGLREDLALMWQMNGTVPTGMNVSARLALAALCIIQ